MEKVSNSDFMEFELLKSLTSSTKLFSLMSIMWIVFGFLLSISLVTCLPIDPAPPIIKNVELDTIFLTLLHEFQYHHQIARIPYL